MRVDAVRPKLKRLRKIRDFLRELPDDKFDQTITRIRYYRGERPICAGILGWLPDIFPKTFKWQKHNRKMYVVVPGGKGVSHGSTDVLSLLGKRLKIKSHVTLATFAYPGPKEHVLLKLDRLILNGERDKKKIKE